jgi:hypothetical protein
MCPSYDSASGIFIPAQLRMLVTFTVGLQPCLLNPVSLTVDPEPLLVIVRIQGQLTGLPLVALLATPFAVLASFHHQ